MRQTIRKKVRLANILSSLFLQARFLTPRDFVYLRFTDLNNPSQVYRTPLFFPSWSWICAPTKMKKTVGVVFIEFDKSSKAFTLGLSSPKKSIG
ncbi:hypothetical protein ACFS4T_33895 [Pseudomonas lini]